MSVFSKKSKGEERPQRKNALAAPLTTRSKNGLFSTAMIALAVVIVVILNLAVSQIPVSWRQFDLSDNKAYSISDTTTTYMETLEEAIDITVVATKESTDSRIVSFLQRYANLSDLITLEWIDPVAYPSALTEYDCESNTVVVSCDATGQTRQISFDDILVLDDYYYYYYGTESYTSFDGEGQLTSAIDYVVSDVSYKIYVTENHGESDPATYMPTLKDRLEKNHFSIDTLSLLQSGSVPEDCDLLMICAPTADFSAEEIQMVEDYLAAGGQVTLFFEDATFERANLDSLLNTYGLQMTDGYVGDTSRYYPAAQSYYAFFPELDTDTDAAEGISDDALVLAVNSYGMTQIDPARDTITVTPFLETSDAGVLQVGQENVSGQYILGAIAEENLEDDTTSRLTVFSTSSVVNENLIAQFGDSIANLSVFMNTITSGYEDISNISIEARSLETPTNTVTNAGLWGLLFVAVLPIAVLAVGFVRWWKRRKL